MATDSPPHKRTNWLKRKLYEALYEPPTNHDGVSAVLKQSHSDNIIDRHSLAIMENTMQIETMHVRDVMIPRTQMVTLALSSTTANLLKQVVESQHSRFPVVGNNRDEVVGILFTKDILEHFINRPEQDFHCKEYLRSPILVPESKRLGALLREFQQKKTHMAMVMDEYGAIAGLITIEDILEQIVGAIEDEHDYEQDNIIVDKGNRFLVEAATPLQEFNAFFNASLAAEDIDTIAGFVIRTLGRLPKRLEEIDIDGFRFNVLQTDNRRIKLLAVSRLSENNAENLGNSDNSDNSSDSNKTTIKDTEYNEKDK